MTPSAPDGAYPPPPRRGTPAGRDEPVEASTASAIGLSAGTRFAHFELLRKLGEGGMGVVFAARDLKLDRVVAVKMILAGRSGSQRMIARFDREVRAAARLRHPGIVPVYEHGQEAGRPWYSMALIEGRGLDQLIREGIDPRRGAALVREAALALDHAHENGVVHRDMKPANVLVDGDDRAFVMDFGLARDLDRAGLDGLTASGALVGTPQYMAPEQFQDARDVGPACDIWALGVTLYELLSGRPPFVAKTLLDLARAVRRGNPDPPRIDRVAPRDLGVVALRALAGPPEMRYASALDFADDIDRALRGVPIHARPVGVVERAVVAIRRHPSILVACAAVVAITTVAWVKVEEAREREKVKELALDRERFESAQRELQLQAQVRRERARADAAALAAKEAERVRAAKDAERVRQEDEERARGREQERREKDRERDDAQRRRDDDRATADTRRREDDARRRDEDAADAKDPAAARTRLAALAATAKDPHALVRLARLHVWAGDLEAASARYQDAAALAPGDQDPVLERMLCRILQSDIRAQLESQMALARSPQHPIVRVLLSVSMKALSGGDGLDPATEKALEKSPVAGLLRLFVAQEQPSVKRYEAALAERPGSGMLAAHLAMHLAARDPTKALAVLDEARDYQGWGVAIRSFARGMAHEAQKRLRDAELDYAKVDGPPLTALAARARRAELAIDRGDLEAAVAAFDGKEPGALEDRTLLARALLGLGKTKEARDVLDRAAVLARKGGPLYAPLRAIGASAEDLEPCKMILGEDSLGTKEGREVIGRRGRLAARTGDRARAEKDLKVLADDDPERGALAGTLALEEGKAKEALAALDKAIATDEVASDVWWDRARALEKLGRRPEAAKAYDEAAKRDKALARVAKEAAGRVR